MKFYPKRFSPGIERVFRNLINEVNDKHPFWDRQNYLFVNEILFYTDDQEITNEGNIEWKPYYRLILIEIGLAEITRREYWNKHEELLFDRQTLSPKILILKD